MLLYLGSLVPTFAKIFLTERRYCFTINFEMGSLLAACTPKRTSSENIFRRGIVSLIPWRLVGMHSKVQKSSHYLHAVLSFFRVKFEGLAATSFCAASYTDDDLQRTSIGVSARD